MIKNWTLVCTGLFGLSYTVTSLANSCAKDVTPLIQKIFSTLGNDCSNYVSLYSKNARYYHQHDGFKTAPELLKTCQNYATFCPGKSCKFQQNGNPMLVARENTCHILVPYLWSEIPANNKAPNNLEPHTGWEYIAVSPDKNSPFKYTINSFAEIESTYSVSFNWSEPSNTPSNVAQSTLKLLALENSASKGECDKPIAPILTEFFKNKSNRENTWKKQGDAIVLAAGGICHVLVPFAAQVGDLLKTGIFVFLLETNVSLINYKIIQSIEFIKN
ncbi:hypothetical protein ACWNT8_10560 [Pigmentibacter ruber]